MADEQDKDFNLDIPVVASRREFFEQEAVVAEPAEELPSDLEPDGVAESLKQMRESATERTNAALEADSDTTRTAGP